MAVAQVERRRATSSNERSAAKAQRQSFQPELKNNERYKELLQAADLVDGVVNQVVVIPLRSSDVTINAPDEKVNDAGQVRGLATTSRKGAGRGMPPFILAFFIVSAVLLLISPGDYIGEIKGILAVLVPLGLYWLTQRGKRKAQEDAQQHRTTDRVFEFSTDKEKRLEERETRLRQEEREFAHQQIRLSRQRSHILARGYMSMWLKNQELINILHEQKICFPPHLLTQETHEQILGELKAVEDEQAATTESHQKVRS